VRDVQVTLQDVYHPRCYENEQRLAGNIGKSERWLIVPTSAVTAFFIKHLPHALRRLRLKPIRDVRRTS
jgi:hypothetical protein